MGLVLASNGIGASILTQIVAPMIYDADNPFGYRNAYRFIVYALLITIVFIAILYKEKPYIGDETYVAPKKKRKVKRIKKSTALPINKVGYTICVL